LYEDKYIANNTLYNKLADNPIPPILYEAFSVSDTLGGYIPLSTNNGIGGYEQLNVKIG